MRNYFREDSFWPTSLAFFFKLTGFRTVFPELRLFLLLVVSSVVDSVRNSGLVSRSFEMLFPFFWIYGWYLRSIVSMFFILPVLISCHFMPYYFVLGWLVFVFVILFCWFVVISIFLFFRIENFQLLHCFRWSIILVFSRWWSTTWLEKNVSCFIIKLSLVYSRRRQWHISDYSCFESKYSEEYFCA